MKKPNSLWKKWPFIALHCIVIPYFVPGQYNAESCIWVYRSAAQFGFTSLVFVLPRKVKVQVSFALLPR